MDEGQRTCNLICTSHIHHSSETKQLPSSFPHTRHARAPPLGLSSLIGPRRHSRQTQWVLVSGRGMTNLTHGELRIRAHRAHPDVVWARWFRSEIAWLQAAVTSNVTRPFITIIHRFLCALPCCRNIGRCMLIAIRPQTARGRVALATYWHIHIFGIDMTFIVGWMQLLLTP